MDLCRDRGAAAAFTYNGAAVITDRDLTNKIAAPVPGDFSASQYTGTAAWIGTLSTSASSGTARYTITSVSWSSSDTSFLWL